MGSPTTTQELESARAYHRAHLIPKRALAVMDAATAEPKASEAAHPAPQSGDIAPDFILPNVDGGIVRLYAELEHGRSYSCSIAEFGSADTQVIAVSPQLPDQSLSTQQKNGLTFPVLSDLGSHAAHGLRIAFELPKPLLDLYEDFDHALVESNGEEGGGGAIDLGRKNLRNPNREVRRIRFTHPASSGDDGNLPVDTSRFAWSFPDRRGQRRQ